MPGCILRVSGTTAKVRKFLAASSLEPCKVFYRGEPQLLKSRGLCTTSGFNVRISSTDLDYALARQCVAATNFLKKHRQDFALLQEIGLSGAVLDFGLADLATENNPWPSYKLSPKLISLAGEFGLGIELSFYGS